MSARSTFDPTAFGVRREDEQGHPFDPSVEWWNESWFWDWYDADGTTAGHCRIGVHPVQDRVWLWLFVRRDGEWIGIEAPRLPLGDVDLARLAYHRLGLRFFWQVGVALETGRLEVEGIGRVLSGPRAGGLAAVAVALDVVAIGPAHSIGAHTGTGHASQTHAASRFEQPITVSGSTSVNGNTRPFTGRGERDHSWGPRFWELEWTFLAANGAGVQVQCVEARIGEARFALGYLQRETMIHVESVDFDLRLADELRRAVGGRATVRGADGSTFTAAVETIDATEIDLSHCLVPPRRSTYRRALVRLTPGAGPPLVGWIEVHRLPEPR